MKRTDFFAGQGARKRHSGLYGNDEQRSHAEKDPVSWQFLMKRDLTPTYLVRLSQIELCAMVPTESDFGP